MKISNELLAVSYQLMHLLFIQCIKSILSLIGSRYLLSLIDSCQPIAVGGAAQAIRFIVMRIKS